MPPTKTQVPCPNCRMPVAATIEQLFDVTQDPSAKQRFMSGRFNLIQCPQCRFQGQATTPLMYHDAEKELLLSFVPMELAMPQAEQERFTGRLMKDIMQNLPPEKRKGYLLSPKPFFTLQNLVDRVWEADGVTKAQLDAQRAKVALAQKFLAAPADQWETLVKDNDAQLDEMFFQLITSSIEATAAGGNQGAAQQMLNLRNKVLEFSSYGAQARAQQAKIEAVARELQALGQQLTPDKLLELVLKAEEDVQVMAYVSFVRPAMDYAFFEAITRRIDRATGDEKLRLTQRRELLLKLTQEIDQAEQARIGDATEVLRAIVEAPNWQEALQESLPYIDDTFMQVLSANVEAATKANRHDVVDRLTLIHDFLMRLIQESAPPEIRFVNELLQMPSEEASLAALKQRTAELTPAAVDAMTQIAQSLQQNGRTELADRLERLRAEALGLLMDANWKK